jgi:hypothetical protein
MNGSDFGGPESAVSIAEDTTPENEESKIDAARVLQLPPGATSKQPARVASLPFPPKTSHRGGKLYGYYLITAAVGHCLRALGFRMILFAIRSNTRST